MTQPTDRRKKRTRSLAPAPLSRVPALSNDKVPFPASQSIPLAMRIALFGLRSSFKAVLARNKVPWSAWYYLRVLYEWNGISQQELTDRVGTMQPNTVSALRNLQRAGLVRVERQEKDRRRTCVWLTPKAQRLMRQLLPEMNTAMQGALIGFTAAQERALIRLLHKLCDNVQPSSRNGTPT